MPLLLAWLKASSACVAPRASSQLLHAAAAAACGLAATAAVRPDRGRARHVEHLPYQQQGLPGARPLSE
jgi:hypothetical protein